MPLRIVTADPLNAEASPDAVGAMPTPVEHFYVRNNFPMPDLDAAAWRLRVYGRVRRPLELALDDLMAMPQATVRVTLECAGNGRELLDPPVEGTRWGLGAAGTADFTGTPLRGVLGQAGLDDDVVECLFSGADEGDIPGWGRVRFERSLGASMALSDTPLLAWAMNGRPLTREHGFPLRLLVPGYYAVASVKWLTRVEALSTPFDGHFQTDRYMYRDADGARPVTHMRVRALVTSHADGQRVPAGRVLVAGTAWSGRAAIAAVDVQVDNGDWQPARVEPGSAAGLAARWRWEVDLAPGVHTVRVRATDGAGETQPAEQYWNELGYGNNMQQLLRLTAL